MRFSSNEIVVNSNYEGTYRIHFSASERFQDVNTPARLWWSSKYGKDFRVYISFRNGKTFVEVLDPSSGFYSGQVSLRKNDQELTQEDFYNLYNRRESGDNFTISSGIFSFTCARFCICSNGTADCLTDGLYSIVNDPDHGTNGCVLGNVTFFAYPNSYYKNENVTWTLQNGSPLPTSFVVSGNQLFIPREYSVDSRGTDVTVVATFNTHKDFFNIHVAKENNTLGTVSLKSVPSDTSENYAEVNNVISQSITTDVTYRLTAVLTSQKTPSGVVVGRFDGWYENDILLSENATYDFSHDSTSDLNIVAKFSYIELDVSANVDPASVSKSAGTATVENLSGDGSTFHYNDVAKFTATPNGAYRFVEWRLPNGTAVPDSTVGDITYTSKDAVYKKQIVGNTTLVAYFAATIKVTPSFDDDSSGSYSIACTYAGKTETHDGEDGFIPLANLAGSSVKLTALPTAPTSIFVGWFDPSDTAFEHPLSQDAEYTLPSELTTNADFVARFAPKPITATVGVESYSSAVNAGQVTASVAGRAEVADALYGDIMTIIASTNSDYLVGRWEDADGNPLPDSVINNVIYHATDATYKMRLTEDIAIFHRFRGTVTLTPTHSASAHDGTLSVDGKTNVEPVYFGHDFTIRAVPASGEVFKEWYSTDDIGMYNPLRYGSEFTTTFSDNTELIGHFVADVAADYSYIAICNVDASGLPLPSAGSVVPSALAESTSAEFLAHSGFSSLPTGAVAYYKCLAITDTRIVATAASGMGVLKWSRELVGKTEADVGGVAYYKDDYVFKSAVYRVYWEDKSPQNVRVGYGNSFDYTSGAFALDGLDVANPSINDRHVQFGVITDIYSKDDIVRLGFTANSGYKFAGWYLDAALTVPIPDIEYRDSAYTSASNPSVLKIPSGANNHVDVYAKIEQDRNAVYEWEGSDVNKSMRWKSKVMAASKPLAPSVVRVDATSYPLSLDVGLFSSPNSERVRGCTIAISGQNARRVPAHNRPERYVQVTVEADHEVDSVIVGTSMAGVSV